MDETGLKRCIYDACNLAELVSEDIDLVDIGQDKEGRWVAWHVEYPDEGCILLAPAREGRR
jgi:hypothetical protein